MNRVELSAVGREPLLRADLALDPGVHTVVALTPDGADELVRIASGTLRPTRGVVLVDGVNPYTSPVTRRKIGSLFAAERLSDAQTVEGAVEQALLMRGSPKTARSVLEAFGLSSFSARKPAGLSPNEARGVALALALASADGGILVLFEPLATPLGRARIAHALADAARNGASVLAVTASTRDASDLGGRSYPLRFGRVGGETPLPSLGVHDDTALEMVVRTDEPRRLASALSLDPAFSSIRCDLASAPDEVVVAGSEPDRVALGVLRGARGSGAKILALFQRKRAAMASTGARFS